QMGVIAFRVLAGGALSGQTTRHPVAARSVDTIASNASFAADVAQASAFHFLINQGWADNLIEAAIRFVLNHPGISTAPIGLSSLDQLEQAVAAIEKGPLPPEAIDQLFEVWAALTSKATSLS
ncbi:MAG: aldo/keto reductase, partial [Anaerolineae bacterium]|nr:aldo/keto reductase [Anaerolineae bacterium]